MGRPCLVAMLVMVAVVFAVIVYGSEGRYPSSYRRISSWFAVDDTSNHLNSGREFHLGNKMDREAWSH